MKFLADENVPQELIDILLQNNIDVISVRPEHSGISDEADVELSNTESRTIISFDKDFGKLIFHKKIKPAEGIIFIRDNPVDPKAVADTLIKLFKYTESFKNSIIVIENVFIKRREF
jgi:predicted nuclease of predicted toxin-antitoxin system